MSTGASLAAALLIGGLFEGVCLAMFGTTPGKALMGARVRDVHGRRPGFFVAPGRFGYCAMAGRGLGIPLVGLATLVGALTRYEKTRSTLWDEYFRTRVERAPVAWWRWGTALAVWVRQAALVVADRLVPA